MTKKHNSLTLKAKSILVLAISLMLCLVTFFGVACSTEEETSTPDKEYSKTEPDTAEILNSSFELGTYSLDLDDFPKTSSISGWSSVSADNSADSSKVNSGVVKTSDKAWKELLNTLYKDSDFKNYVKEKWNITDDNKDDAENGLLKKFPSPNVDTDVEGDQVLMINNFSEYYKNGEALGTAQKITSSTTVKLDKGEYGILTVKVMTRDLVSPSTGENGANIRLINSFNSKSQADYAIYGINTEGAWKTYTLYVKGDANYETSFKVALGLGIGNGKNELSGWTQGTAFFDDITFNKYKIEGNTDTANDYANKATGITASEMVYSGEDAIYANVGTDTVFAYDMTFKTGNYFTDYDLTTSTIDLTEGIVNANVVKDYTLVTSGDNNQNATLTINQKGSYTIVTNDFTVAPESYKYVSFTINNKLNKLNNTEIKIYVYDIVRDTANPSIILSKNVSEPITITETSEKDYGILVKNNFTSGNKTFFLKIVVGPTVFSGLDLADYAVGTVEFKNVKTAEGLSYQYVKDGNGNPTETETDNYDLYSFYSSAATKSVALYAGYLGDYTDDTNSESYTLSTSASSYGTIFNGTANLSGYDGVTTNSVYMDSSDANTNKTYTINSKTNGYAGLINTKYLANYGDVNTAGTLRNVIGNSLNGLYKTDKNIQPLMIYNADADSYGFIGKKAITVEAGGYAKVSVDVKVIGDAKAYVYLAQANGKTKDVLDLTLGDKTYQTSFVVDSNLMGDEDWITLTFYVAAGENPLNLRLEMWNGSRDGVSKSQGLVYFNNIQDSGSTFTEFSGNSITEAARESGGALFGIDKDSLESSLTHKRELDETEIEYNAENPDKAVSYDEKIIWAKSNTIVYAIYNSIEPIAVDPNVPDTPEEEVTESCAETDPASFWLSLSSIIIGAALLFAIVMLFVRRAVNKRKANASDALSHYKVRSRISYKKNDKQENKSDDVIDEIVNDEVPVEEIQPEQTEETISEEKTETLDEYVYGDVQDFGEGEVNTNETQSSENEEPKTE